MAEPYIPSHEPFHSEPDGFRVWEMEREGHYIVCNDSNGNTYRGGIAGVALFIERERKNRERNR